MIATPRFYHSTIGKKIICAATGLLLFAFVIGHMLGNLKMFRGFDAAGVPALDHYAEFLRTTGEMFLGRSGLLWLVRVVLISAATLHITLTVQLWRRNQLARPVPYVRKVNFMASTASRTMFWGGLLLALFIVLHILHFTTGSLDTAHFVSGHVYANVYAAFRRWPIALAYVAAMAVLALHLYHGAWSMVQTLGLDDVSRNRRLRAAAALAAAVLFIGFAAVPLAVLLNIVPPPAAAGE